jgi:sec-independent protein translocase protein TatC
MTDQKMPLTAHLEELRKRLITSFIALAVGFGISYGFKEELFLFLSGPLLEHLPEESTLQYIGIPEAFLTYLKLSLFGGLVLAMPVIFYQIWRFVAPGLYEREKRYFIPFVLFSMVFFLGGTSFCYYIVFPFVFRFFMSFSGDSLLAMPAIRQYLSFATRLLIAFGLVFEMPIFFFFLGRVGLVSYKGLARQRRMAVVLVFLGAALLTPPDVVSQLMLAGPLMILFELSIQIVRITGKKPDQETDIEEKEEEAEEAPVG